MPPPPRKKKFVPVATPVADAPSFPMRINRYLAHKGHATRRDADTLIEKGQVLLNGKPAKLGDKVNASDNVEVRSRSPRAYIYLALHKPKGLTTLSDVKGEKDVLSLLPSDLKRLRLFPIGRLDKESSGLMLVTNDGRLTDRLLNPDRDHEKVYEVTTKLPLRDSFAEHMSKGVQIEGEMTRPANIEVTGESAFRITLTEGKKHQIRRMVVAMHNEVKDLKRTNIGTLSISGLAPGAYRRIEGKDLEALLSSLGLQN